MCVAIGVYDNAIFTLDAKGIWMMEMIQWIITQKGIYVVSIVFF